MEQRKLMTVQCSFCFPSPGGCQTEFPSAPRPPRRDAQACGRNVASGGEVGRLCDWRLRSDVGLFSWAGPRPKTSSAPCSASARCWPDGAAPLRRGQRRFSCVHSHFQVMHGLTARGGRFLTTTRDHPVRRTSFISDLGHCNKASVCPSPKNLK